MGFNLDKHDLFRNGVPGFAFLLVLFSFYYANNDFVFHTGDNIATFLGSVAIALTIGYLLHNIYRGIHIIFELRRWESDEADMVRQILNEEQLANLIIDPRAIIPRDWILNQLFRAGNTVDKQISWFIESCLHVDSSKSIRERGYHLVSRIHSIGGSMLAIALGIVFSIFYLYQKCFLFERWGIFLLISVVWVVIIGLFNIARTSTFDNYLILIRHFVVIRQKLMRDIASHKIDPFEKEDKSNNFAPYA